MLAVSLAIKPGVDVQSTAYQTGAGMQTSQLLRYRNGLIQKLGGCQRFITDAFGGVCTHILPWAALDGTEYVGLGTTVELDVIAAGALNVITPGAGVGTGIWSLDKWGENLIAAPQGSTIYQWVPPVSLGNIALPLTNAPSQVNGCIVAAPQQQIIAWGIFSGSLGIQDPLLIGWCDVGDNTVWTASSTNQAGTFRLSTGSRIQQVLWYGLAGLVWTDVDMWSMTYASFPLIYGFNQIAPNCGAISPRAADRLGTRIAWMGYNDFFLYQGGQVAPMECGVWDFVFDNLDRDFQQNCFACSNSYFNEMAWRFPMKGSDGVCNGYAKWNAGGANLWDYGEGDPQVSAWADASIIGQPLGTSYGGFTLQFEKTNDFDGDPRNSGFQSGWFNLGEGEEVLFVERILPDFTLNASGQVSLTIDFADQIPEVDTDYPIRSYGPFTVTQSTPYIIVRGSGRVARITLLCTAPDTFWRYGKPIATVSIDGRPA